MTTKRRASPSKELPSKPSKRKKAETTKPEIKPESIFPLEWKQPEIKLDSVFDFVVEGMPRVLFEKMRKQKRLDGYSGFSWVDYWAKKHAHVVVEDALEQVIYRQSGETLRPLWMTNYARNLSIQGYEKMNDSSIQFIKKFTKPTALIVGAGPTISNNHLIERLAKAKWKGNIVATDRMTIPLIEAGLELACVCSVDGNPDKIPVWFDKDILEEYNDKRPDKPLIVVCATTVSPETIKVLEKRKCKVYWFHGMLDMFFNAGSITRVMSDMVPKVTMLTCGGNAGTTAWNLAHYLGAKTLGLIGLDFGYTPDTLIEKTAYYDSLSKHFNKSQMKFFYREDYHPFFQTKAYTDIVFYSYRETFRRSAIGMKLKGIKTINCTEGGTLHGSGIIPMWFDKTTAKAHGLKKGFLETYPK